MFFVCVYLGCWFACVEEAVLKIHRKCILKFEVGSPLVSYEHTSQQDFNRGLIWREGVGIFFEKSLYISVCLL